jgi:hypothetical protein
LQRKDRHIEAVAIERPKPRLGIVIVEMDPESPLGRDEVVLQESRRARAPTKRRDEAWRPQVLVQVVRGHLVPVPSLFRSARDPTTMPVSG